MSKSTVCEYCGSVNSHFSFQCYNKPTSNKPRSEVKKKKSINPISNKQKTLLAEYRVVRDEFMKANTICQAKLERCTYEATDLHHKRSRGKYLSVVKYFMAVCRNCHTEIHEKSEQSYRLGHLISKLEKESD